MREIRIKLRALMETGQRMEEHEYRAAISEIIRMIDEVEEEGVPIDPGIARVVFSADRSQSPKTVSALEDAINEQLHYAGESPMNSAERSMIGLAVRPKFQIGEVAKLKKIAGDMPERLIGQNAEVRSTDHGLYRLYFGAGELDYWASEDMLESVL